jgi:recombination protein RecR
MIRAFANLPGLGPRSARRIALHLLTHKSQSLLPFIKILQDTTDTVQVCEACGNLDTQSPCRICRSENRNRAVICIVADVADLWAIERTGAYKGLYHTLGGLLSAMDGITPGQLHINSLLDRLKPEGVEEIILALSATVDGQATAHYITDRMRDLRPVRISRLAHGVPVGGQLDYLDEGTIATALKSRASL